MAIDRLVDSILDYFRLPEHKKFPPPGTGAASHPLRTDQPIPPRQAAVQPVAPQAAPAQSTGNPIPQTPAGVPADADDPIRILLVEDDHKWAKLVQAYVNAINKEATLGVVELSWVETLQDTIGKISKRSYDLIFLDLMLPDSQGIHTLESVWDWAVRVRTPVVVMSNLDSGAVMDRVREVTGRDILLKKNISKKVLFGHIDFNVFED